MPCTNQDAAARAYDPPMATTAERRPGGTEAPHPRLTAVQDSPVQAPLVAREFAGRSNRVFNRLVAVGLTILVVLLAAVMLNAGVNVEVLL